MLLAIDCGNTNTVFAVYDGDTQVGKWRIATNAQRTSDEYAVWLTQLMSLRGLGVDDIDHAIVTTVVPGTRRNLDTLLDAHFDVTPLVARWSRTYDLYVRLKPDTPLTADGVRSTNERFRADQQMARLS